jgi:peptide/nickel transport system permease protein
MNLAVFIARRVVAGIVTILGIYTLTFVICAIVPSEPAFFIYPAVQQLTPYQLAHAHHLFGVDKSLFRQYVDFLWSVRHGFGMDWQGATLVQNTSLHQTPIGPEITQAAGVTISLVAGGAVVVALLALPLAVLAARRPGSFADRFISTFALTGICIHPMVLGLVVTTVFSNYVHVIPAGGYCPLRGPYNSLCPGPQSWFTHLLLAWVCFALLFLGLYTRMIRGGVIETSHEDFVRTAYAKGASTRRVLVRHVLPNVGLRVLTMVGMEVGTALGVCVFIEQSFGLQGLGRLSLEAMILGQAIDTPLVLAIVLVITTLVVTANLVVDVLGALLDPRVRATGALHRSRRAPAAVI